MWRNKKKRDNALENLTGVESKERIFCRKRSEQVFFDLRNERNKKITVELTDVLECLVFAIEQGELSQLPRSWCSEIESRFNVKFGKDVFYHDYNEER